MEPSVHSKILRAYVADDTLLAIGRVITQWSFLETMVDSCIWQAGGIRNDMGRIVSAQMQMQSKLDTLHSILNQKFPWLGEQFSPVSKYVKECLSGKRNIVAHGMWVTLRPNKSSLVVKLSARGKLKDQGGYMDAAEIESLAADISDVTVWVLQLCERLPKLKTRRGELIRKAQETPRPQDGPARKLHALRPLRPREKDLKRLRNSDERS
jgi:hypothetical protein